MSKLMLDTNVFNQIAKGGLNAGVFNKHEVFGTHVQLDEIDRTNDETLRTGLKSTFTAIIDTRLATSSMVWDVSRWDGSNWSDGKIYSQLHQRLIELDGNKKVNAKTPNQFADVLIAETAINNNLVLVTNDENLATLFIGVY